MTCVGETVADFSLQNCHSGEMVSVWSLMEDLRAFLLVATSGWCEYCDNWVPQVIDQTDGTAVEGLGGLVVFGEDSDGERPDLEECRSYAERLGRDASRFYIDHAYATTFDNIFCHPDEQLVFDLPWSAVIDPATKELVYVDRADQTNLQEALDGLLSQ